MCGHCAISLVKAMVDLRVDARKLAGFHYVVSGIE
jgi:hypothetical protein